VALQLQASYKTRTDKKNLFIFKRIWWQKLDIPLDYITPYFLKQPSDILQNVGWLF